MDMAIERLESLRIADVMTRNVFSVRAEETLDRAAHLFLEKGVASAPVVDESGQCVGMVGLRELLRKAVGDGEIGDMQPASSGSVLEGDGELLPARPAEALSIRAVMNHGVQTIAPETGILAAARIMCLQHAHRLVVLDQRGAPIGMVSSMDLVSTLVNVMDEMQRISMPDPISRVRPGQ